MGSARLKPLRALLGGKPRAFILLAAPTLLALLVDAAVRASAFMDFAPQGKAIYGSSLLVSAGFWILPMWVVTKLSVVVGPRAGIARIARFLIVAFWIMPFAAFSFGGQLLYYRVFHSYMGRDSVRLGIAARGTLGDWFASWGGPALSLAMIGSAVLVLAISFRATRKHRAEISQAIPVLPVFLFIGAMVCFWTDNVDSRFLQAAVPDACFVHGVVHAFRMRVTGKWNDRHGYSERTPAPLPLLQSVKKRPPSIIVVLTESVRADVICSDPPPRCTDGSFDGVAPDRASLGKLTSQTPNTFSAFMVLTTGLEPNATFTEAHSAPVLWELARAVGYRTGYISSQNPRFEDFGTFPRRAGIDTLLMSTELGGMRQEQLGAPDQRAIDAALAFVHANRDDAPYLLVLHLSNTHAPYLTDPSYLPFQPESVDPLGNVTQFKNHYKNSVVTQQRALRAFWQAVRGTPAWPDTMIFFLSDHGEQFRERGGLYHNHTLFDEELRIPGFVFGGAAALGADDRAALATYAGKRTYMQDVHETLIDAMGLEDARKTLPFAARVRGRSLFRPRVAADEPVALLGTSSAVWEPDDARFGAMVGEKKLWGPPGTAWTCCDLTKDPAEHVVRASNECGPLKESARAAFGADGPIP